MQESKQEVTRVIPLSKMADNLHDVSIPIKASNAEPGYVLKKPTDLDLHFLSLCEFVSEAN